MNFEALMQEKNEQFEQISAIMKTKAEQYQSEMAELQDELLRLQGEYRILSQLREQHETNDIKESLEKEVIEAETIK